MEIIINKISFLLCSSLLFLLKFQKRSTSFRTQIFKQRRIKIKET